MVSYEYPFSPTLSNLFRTNANILDLQAFSILDSFLTCNLIHVYSVVPVFRGTQSPRVRFAQLNREVKLYCQVRLNRGGLANNATSYWLKDNRTLFTASHPRMRIKVNKWLKIKGVKKEDEGKYTCVVANRCGVTLLTYEVLVESKHYLSLLFSYFLFSLLLLYFVSQFLYIFSFYHFAFLQITLSVSCPFNPKNYC